MVSLRWMDSYLTHDGVGRFFVDFDALRRYDDLEPLPGMSLPWEEAGLPRPCVDEPCQVEWMDEFLEPVYPLEVV